MLGAILGILMVVAASAEAQLEAVTSHCSSLTLHGRASVFFPFGAGVCGGGEGGEENSPVK